MSEFIFDIETTGLDPYTDKIVGIGLLNIENKDILKIVSKDERKVILEFYRIIDSDDTLIGFNIRRFDIPHLKVRSIINDVPSLILNEVRIIDLVDILNGIFPNDVKQKYLRLDDWCRILNIRGDFENTGIKVAEWLDKGDIDSISKHLEDDLVKTYQLLLRLKEHFKELNQLGP